ncbi:MAG: hypothetical protein ACFE85_08875 [Candidatus Hodarchaeota archaeon]
MSEIKRLLHDFKSFYNKLSNPKLVKLCIIFAHSIFLTGLLIGVIIAYLFGPESYNIWDNYISDLGSFRYTPAPFILDTIAMMTAVLLVPIFFYLTKEILSNEFPIKLRSIETLGKKLYRLIVFVLGILGFIALLFTVIGLFGIGLFSEDRTTQLGLHFLFSIVVFSGLAFAALFNGGAILLKKTILPRLLGLYMMIGPFTITIMFLFPPPPCTRPFIEWMMLFAAFLWLIPGAVVIFKKIVKDLK